MKKDLLFFGLFSACLIMPLSANTQMFGDEDNVSSSYSAKPTVQKTNNGFVPPAKLLNNPQNTAAQNTVAKKPESAAATAAPAKAAPQNTQAAQQTSKKKLTSDVKQYKIVDGRKVAMEEKEAIYIYYKDFKMVRNLGQTACDVRFVLVTKLAETLNNISMRLVWPKMATKLTFSGVKPGEENYYDYRLYGEGCYSMDKLPNVTVNRCRLKGRSQQECASLVQLMTWSAD